ncbi:carbonic anhydrase [Aromatoleum toluvorans]|uniref:carbonic anhydrase n=1 Tax=Aromatoleum toluvorans TaxID=92002 RepID=A0ABX1Q2Q0_9RHOO|nr:surface-adhesin E family protein [Aromatoleum toluvorans]NMG45989.1 carbonic anhydrase [Aromatoleum toluvorans]
MTARPSILCALLAILLLPAGGVRAEQTWDVVVRDRERIVEIDRSSVIQSDGGEKVAWGRIVLSPERAAIEGFASVKALSRYDCYNRSFFTLKRVYMDDRHVVLREEGGLDERPVLAARNSVDERLWQEVCKPPSVSDLKKVARAVTAIAEAANADAGATPLVPLRRSAAAPAEAPARESARIARQAKGKMPAADAKAAPVVAQPAVPRSAAPATTALAALARTPAPPAIETGLPRPDWSYEGERGPDKWASLRPEWATCAQGKRQSPIDPRDGIVVDLEAPRFDYRETGFRIADTGRTLRVHVESGMGVVLRGRRYELEFFEFHRPSDERIGGQASDMVVHFHHRDAAGNIAVVGVPLESGDRPHPLIQTLWNNLPLERGTDYAPSVRIDPASLLPTTFGHYLFMGSLEAPPCTEGVLWAVMKEPLHLSSDQLAIFARLYARNGRPLQPQNGRLILESR